MSFRLIPGMHDVDPTKDAAPVVVAEHTLPFNTGVLTVERILKSAPHVKFRASSNGGAGGGQVLSLFSQPFKTLSELMFEKKPLIPALKQLVSSHSKGNDG